MDFEHTPEKEDINLEPIDVKSTTETGETGADAALDAALEGAPDIDLQGEVEAEIVHIMQGGAQSAQAEKIFVEQGAIARAEARFIDVHEGAIAIAQGENITISDGGVALMAAENVKMEDSIALFVAANHIEGQDTMVIFDVRAAVVFALVVGLVTSLFKLLTGRRR